MFTLLMVALGALFLAGFVKYTVFVHQAWAEGEGERLGLDAEGRGIGTILRGRHRGVPIWLAMSGRRVTEGEAKLTAGVETPTRAEFTEAQALFGSAHYKPGAVWADFPRSKPGEPPERYADALVIVAAFAATRSLEELSRIEAGEEEE
ncbi:MAG: hypothetical protein H6719_33445 [Sandaracinaceae bacterium]|nr:hypothetical protein [Sandaracinaceae bacterium]